MSISLTASETFVTISPHYLADPFVFRDGSAFFAIGTSSHHPGLGGIAYREPDGRAFGVHRAEQLLDTAWQYCGGLLEPLDLPQHWAPEIVLMRDGSPLHHKGELICFFSAGTDREHMIYVASSPSLTDPFRVRAMVVRGTDPHPHVDEDGDLCLVYVTTWEHPGSCIVGTRLNTALQPFGPEKRLLVPEAPWMCVDGYRIAESPFVVRQQGGSCLLFSGGGWQTNYGTDYASSTRLLGDYFYDLSNLQPRLLRSDPARGIIDPGHCCVVEAGSKHYIAHHQWSDLSRATRNTVIRELILTPT